MGVLPEEVYSVADEYEDLTEETAGEEHERYIGNLLSGRVSFRQANQ